MAATGKQGESKGRKEWCKSYRARGQRELNKERRLARHLKRHPRDKQAKEHPLA